MHPAIYLITITLPFSTAIIVFAMKYASSYAAARARMSEAADFKGLSETQAAVMGRITASLTQIENEIVSQSRSHAAIDAISKQIG